jgi:hypothetical protein
MSGHFPASMAGGIAGFVLGIAVSATTMGVLAYSRTSSSFETAKSFVPTTPDPGKVKTYAHRIVLPSVASGDVDDAIASMGLPPVEQHRVRQDLDEGQYRLLWLTLWDWDTANDKGDTISITGDNYRRLFVLHNRRTRIAIPEPKSGYLELRGEQTEDGIIAISLLSGAQPLALPRMALGQSVKVEVDTP